MNLALKKFEDDSILSNIKTVTPIEKADTKTMKAKKFLRDMRNLIDDNEMITKYDQLIKLIDLGRFATLPNEINKIYRQLEKEKINDTKVQQLIASVVGKYVTDSFTDNNNKEKPLDISPEIVISETFI